jgi:hypothetical protein
MRIHLGVMPNGPNPSGAQDGVAGLVVPGVIGIGSRGVHGEDGGAGPRRGLVEERGEEKREEEKGEREKGEGQREKEKKRKRKREKGKGKREKGEGRREKGTEKRGGRREKGKEKRGGRKLKTYGLFKGRGKTKSKTSLSAPVCKAPKVGSVVVHSTWSLSIFGN